MQMVKKELLEALATELEALLPGSGERAVFEAPKLAAHGDWATTVAMQLAKPLKQSPRDLAQRLTQSLMQTQAYQRWVDALEIAGPGFINLFLTAHAYQQLQIGRAHV